MRVWLPVVVLMGEHGAWWVAHGVVVTAAVTAPIIWLILRAVTDEPWWWIVLGWAVTLGLVVVWVQAAAINATGRRVDRESRVLRPGHRNGRPQ